MSAIDSDYKNITLRITEAIVYADILEAMMKGEESKLEDWERHGLNVRGKYKELISLLRESIP